MKTIPKQHYYVRSGELERWVWAFDETNAVFLVWENMPGGIEIDELFFVSTEYVPHADYKNCGVDLFRGCLVTHDNKSFNVIPTHILEI